MSTKEWMLWADIYYKLKKKSDRDLMFLLEELKYYAPNQELDIGIKVSAYINAVHHEMDMRNFAQIQETNELHKAQNFFDYLLKGENKTMVSRLGILDEIEKCSNKALTYALDELKNYRYEALLDNGLLAGEYKKLIKNELDKRSLAFIQETRKAKEVEKYVVEHKDDSYTVWCDQPYMPKIEKTPGIILFTAQKDYCVFAINPRYDKKVVMEQVYAILNSDKKEAYSIEYFGDRGLRIYCDDKLIEGVRTIPGVKLLNHFDFDKCFVDVKEGYGTSLVKYDIELYLINHAQ